MTNFSDVKVGDKVIVVGPKKDAVVEVLLVGDKSFMTEMQVTYRLVDGKSWGESDDTYIKAFA